MTHEEYVWWCDLGAAVQRVVDLLEAGLIFEPEVFMKRVLSYYPATIRIDGDLINLRIKRLSPVEVDELEANMQEYGYSTDGKTVGTVSRERRREMAQWLQQTLTDMVSVAPGQLEIEQADGVMTEVTTGAQIVTLYGGRTDVMAELLGIAFGEVKLPAERKEQYRASLASYLSGSETPVSTPKRTTKKLTQTPLISETSGAETS